MNGKSKKKAAAFPSNLPASPPGEIPAGEDSRSPKSESPAAGLNKRWLVSGVCLFLAAIIWVVFGQTLGHEFVNYDDGGYVYKNPVVTRGLNLKGIERAFTHIAESNWHPLTMMSHMLDCQLYGLHAGGHHLTNILLHTATAILLFLVLRQMTGKLWRSAFVAAVFAIHPLRVESVAWVAERKDVLSGLFFMLTIGSYVRYARCVTGDGRPVFATLRRDKQVTGLEKAIRAPVRSHVTCHASRFYCLVLLCFALGLMCKPMLVTLPLVLLLLDYWPLGRLSRLNSVPARQAGDKCQVSGPDSHVTPHASRLTPRTSHLLLEKLPLLGLAVASCAVTLFAQNESIQSFENMSLSLRLGNALVSYVAYLGQMFWPSGLAVIYPFTAKAFGISEVMLSLVLLGGISAGAMVLRHRRPYFLTGWLWYLIMLAPVIGILQVGWQARADRYTYLPQIGLYLLLTWAAADLCASWRHRRMALGGCSAILLMALIFCARAQTAYWQNSESLWTHTLACTSDNAVAHYSLGDALLQKGKRDEAIAHFQKALQIKPNYPEALNDLGGALLQKGRVDEAIAHFQRALQINPDYAVAHNNLGYALLQKGRVDEAIAHFQKALQINPDYAEALNNLGSTLLPKGDVDEAIAQYQKALQINPDYAEVCYNLGTALCQKGRVDEAIAQYQKALQIKPDYADAHNNLGYVLLQKGNADEAIAHFQKALQITPDSADAHNNLGYVLLQKGRVDEAIVQYQKVLQITPDSADAHNHLGYALLQKGRADEAITQYQKVLQIEPDSPGVLNNLAWLLATCPDAHIRDGVQAVKYAGRACELTHYGVASLVGTLAAASAEAGRFDEAIAEAQKACALATAAGERGLLEKNQKLLVLYRAHQPYHEAVEKAVPAAP